MLQGVCSPFMLTTPIIGLAIASSSSPMARIKARWGVRLIPCLVMSDLSFVIGCSSAAARLPSRSLRPYITIPDNCQYNKYDHHKGLPPCSPPDTPFSPPARLLSAPCSHEPKICSKCLI